MPPLRDHSTAMLLTCILAASPLGTAVAAPVKSAYSTPSPESLDPGPAGGRNARVITRDDLKHAAIDAAATAALLALLAGRGHGATATTTATATSTATSQ